MDEKIKLIKESSHHRCFYHFTDEKNLNLIKQHGLLSLEKIKAKGITIPAPGGNSLSHDLDKKLKLDSYVHACFTKDHPMAHVAQADGRISKLVWLKINPEVMRFPNVMFAPDIANKSEIEISLFSSSIQSIDWEVIYTRTDWKNTEIKKRLDAARRYEILIPDCIEIKDIKFPDG